jgi:hypothetical protein
MNTDRYMTDLNATLSRVNALDDKLNALYNEYLRTNEPEKIQEMIELQKERDLVLKAFNERMEARVEEDACSSR